jgi:hypothetical protein
MRILYPFEKVSFRFGSINMNESDAISHLAKSSFKQDDASFLSNRFYQFRHKHAELITFFPNLAKFPEYA